jgi:hypothetical protein
MFQQVVLKALVNEMSVTYHYLWDCKSWKYYLFKHPLGIDIVGLLAWKIFNPFRDIVVDTSNVVTKVD